jgi:hypothetical protein
MGARTRQGALPSGEHYTLLLDSVYWWYVCRRVIKSHTGCILTRQGPQYCLAILGFKVSLLASYLRVAGFNRTYAIALYVCIALVTVSQLIFTGLHIASCSPIAKRKLVAYLWNDTTNYLST